MADLVRVVRFYQHIVQDHGQVILVLMTEVPRQPELRELMQTPLAIMVQIRVLIERYQDEGILVREPPIQACTALRPNSVGKPSMNLSCNFWLSD
ncbi:MAG: hypothetical protein AB4911_11815 [Oscillochloridaceae bacterium umkhey_bin13]